MFNIFAFAVFNRLPKAQMSIYAFGFLSRKFYLILCLTKCNIKFIFFCFILLFYFRTLFIKENKKRFYYF